MIGVDNLRANMNSVDLYSMEQESVNATRNRRSSGWTDGDGKKNRGQWNQLFVLLKVIYFLLQSLVYKIEWEIVDN